MLILSTPLTQSNFVDISSTDSSSASQSSLAEPNAKLGWILIHKRWLSAAQLQMVLTQQLHFHHPLGELLLEAGLISEDQLQQALKEQYWRRNGYWVI